jgi:hypothetical protein
MRSFNVYNSRWGWVDGLLVVGRSLGVTFEYQQNLLLQFAFSQKLPFHESLWSCALSASFKTSVISRGISIIER